VRLKRRFPILLAVLLVAAAVVAAVQLRRRAPPEPARLLPSADGFLYVNLKWLRTLKAIGELPAVSHDPEYEQFIQETGFQFERDLDEAAFAVHYGDALKNPKPGAAAQAHFSEVFVGKIETQRLTAYLHKIATSIDEYHSSQIYNLPLDGRTLRVAILSVDSVAVSNHDDPGVIRGMIDRTHKLASPFAGPALLRQYYKALPVVSKTLPVVKLAWFIGRIEPSSTPDLGGWSMLFQRPTPLVVSAYYPLYSPSLHVRAEAFAGGVDEAQGLTDKVSTFLSLFHAAELSVESKGADPDVKAFFDSLNVARHDDRAVLTASLPPGFLKKMIAEPQPELAPGTGSMSRSEAGSGTQTQPATSSPSKAH
jgi:hypothetical protein